MLSSDHINCWKDDWRKGTPEAEGRGDPEAARIEKTVNEPI